MQAKYVMIAFNSKTKIKKNSRRRPRSVDDAEFGHFTLLFCRTAKKCTKIYNAHAQSLFFLIKAFVW